MNKSIFNFGEKVKGFKVRVLNEREVRAGAGILFFFAILSFSSAWFTGNFQPTKLFVIAFLIDFFIRIFVNPKYAPSLIVGRFVVSNQEPEYVGAPQKKFAWAMGFVLALAMFFLTVINNIMGPVNLLICVICLFLLFFESAFGICLGCKMYNRFNKKKAQLCPGGTCKVKSKKSIQKINMQQILVACVFLVTIGLVSGANFLQEEEENHSSGGVKTSISEENEWSPGSCAIPTWVKDIGHEEKYKKHHGCGK